MHKIHDRGYKRLFSNRCFFRQLLENFVAQAWIKEIDFNQSEKLDKTFINPHYKETESDILYKVKFKQQDAYVYILIEFQSSNNPFMALRVLHYMSSIWLDHAENQASNAKLPPIFPIVLYSGNERWTAATEFRELLEKPDLFEDYVPHFKYFKIAANEYTQTQLLKLSNVVSMLFLAETQHDIETLKEELLSLFDKKEDKQAISLLLNWFEQLMIHGHREPIDYQALETIYHSKEEARTMLENTIARERQTFFDNGKLEGKLEGKIEGKIEGKLEGKLETAKAMLAEGLDPSLVIKVTKLPAEEIERLIH